MKKRVFIPILLVMLLMVAAVPAAFAAPGQDTVIEANEVVNNDVVVLDGDLEIQEGAVVNGDVAVFNGDAEIDGRVNGSITLFNGDLETGDAAAITGECVLLNGSATGAQVTGSCTSVQNLEFGEWRNFAPNLFFFPDAPEMPAMPEIAPLPTMPAMPDMPEMPAMPEMPSPSVPAVPRAAGPEVGFRHTVGQVFGILGSSLLFGFLGLLAAVIMPNQLRQIVATAREKSVVSGGVGVLTAVAVPSLIVLLIPVSILLTFVCIGLLGFPIMFLLALGLVVGGFLGWIAVGTWLGMRLFGGRGKQDHIVRSAALGTGLLTLIVGLVSLLPFVIGESLLVFILTSIGLGAVALTQFGMKPYPRVRPHGTPGGGEDAGKVDTVLQTLPPEEAAGQGA